ncbi:MAG: SRPBCC family protein [Methylocapsa sp.]|nr:SRPBCC family protein [Methylocapsa sp.]
MPDRIEKKVHLRSSLERVWQAISNAEQFGRWFGVNFDGPFIAGTRLKGRIAPTQVDPEVAKLQKPHEGKVFDFEVDRIEPMKRISFRWHPFAIDPNFDYSKEPMTLIVFELEEVADGVLLTISESGFDKIPLERRAQAFTANDGGWTKQTGLIRKFLTSDLGA